MALRRRDVILAGIAAFIAWGFVTHWIPSSRYLPWAFSAGVISTLVLLAWLTMTTSRGSYTHERAWNYGTRHAAFAKPDAWKRETKALNTRSEYLREPIYEPSFVISDTIDGLVDLILRDFVRSWYDRISGRPAFTIEVDRAVRVALGNVRDRILAVDLVAVGSSRLIPIITNHMKDFYEAEKIVRGRRLSRNVTESEELDLAIAGKYKDGKLHPAASLAFSNTKLIQQQQLRSIVTRLLPKVLPKNMTTSPAVTVLIKEIVACAVLFPVMQILSDPDTWNQIMEGYGRSILQDRKTVRKLRAALDEHAPPSPKQPKPLQFPKLSPEDNERKFERFIRAIKQCNSLSDARRFRSDIASQIRRDSALENPDVLYIRRLETGKRMLDQRVAQLGVAGGGRPKLSVQQSSRTQSSANLLENSSLREVLYSASGLSYFMEFMDRQNLMRLVQFWIVVDGMRNPLEQDNEDPEDSGEVLPQWSPSERTDLAQINEAYLSRSELKIALDARQTVSAFLKAGRDATPLQYQLARRAVLRAQTAAYNEMVETYFSRFKKSDLWYKWLAADGGGATTSSPTLSYTADDGSLTAQAPVKASRAPSSKPGFQKPVDLRRAAASSSDLPAFAKPGSEPVARRSLDATPSRAPLFDDEYDSDILANSTHSLNSDTEPARTGNDPKIVDAMHAALNDIMVDDGPDVEHSTRSPVDSDSLKDSFEIPRSSSPMPQKGKISIASLGLVGAPSRLGVFTDDDLFGEEEKFQEDEVEEKAKDGGTDDEEIHEAAPGDLGLAEAIDMLTQDVERLVTQESIVDSLTNKAELTNNAAELRILRKSKASLQREIHRKELQRQQYIVQESDNSLYGRATVSITSIMVGTEEDGHEYAMYVIEVKRKAGEQMPAAVWAISKRYSEFHELNKRLKARYPQIRNLEFPRRQVMLKLQKDFLQKRRLILQNWLRELLLIPAICRSRELRAFLSQQAISSIDPQGNQVDSRDFVSRIYSSVTDGMEEFLGNIPVLDQLSVAGQNLISAATSQLATSANGAPGGTLTTPILLDDPATASEAEAELRAFESRELEPFVKPIADLFLEVFSLNQNNNWLRGRAVVVVLHQLLGGTIERKVREMASTFFEEDNVVKYLNMARDMMWPNGKMRTPVPRTTEEKARSKKEADVLLGTLVPDLAANVVGRANAQQASRRIAATLNNQRLNTHLVFTLLDEIISVMFGEPSLR